MGTLMPVLSAVSSTIGTIGAIDRGFNAITGADDRARRNALRAQQDQALAQLQARQGQDLSAAQRDAANERSKIALDAKAAETTRLAALRRAMARQNARFGASGITSTSGGSREAVLLGLYNESDEERTARENLDRLRYGIIDNDLKDYRQRNVLEYSQLAERNRLNSILER